MDNESKLSAALARAKQGRLDAALAKVRTRNVDARLGALLQNYTGDPTAPMMRQQVDQARDLAARGMIAPEQIESGENIGVARSAISERDKPAADLSALMRKIPAPPEDGKVGGLSYQQPQRFGTTNPFQKLAEPVESEQQKRAKAQYEQAVRTAANEAFGGVLPESLSQGLYQAARGIQDANVFATPIEELLKPKGMVPPGSDAEVAALSAKVAEIRATSKSEDEFNARVADELSLMRREYETKKRTQEQDVAGVTGAEAAIRSKDVGAAVGRATGDFAQMILNLEAGGKAGLPMPVAMGAQSAIVPEIKELQGGPEAEGDMAYRFGEGWLTGYGLKALGYISKLGLDRAFPSTAKSAELLKNVGAQSTVGFGTGVMNAQPGEEIRQGSVEAVLNAALTAASGGRYLLGTHGRDVPVEPGKATPYVAPEGKVGGAPEAPVAKPVVAPEVSAKKPRMVDVLTGMDAEKLAAVRKDPAAARALADEYGQTIEVVRKAATRVAARSAPPSATTKVPGSDIRDHLAAMSGEDFKAIGGPELKSLSKQFGVKEKDVLSALEREVSRRTGEVIPRGTAPDKALDKAVDVSKVADLAADAPASQQVKHMYSGISYHELREMTIGVARGVRDAALKLTEATRPRFWNTMKSDPAAARLAVEDVAAPDHSKTTSKLWYDTMKRIAADAGRVSAIGDLPKLLYEQQARAIELRNAGIRDEIVKKVGREDVFLTSEERAKLTNAKTAATRLKKKASLSDAEKSALAEHEAVISEFGPRRDAYNALSFNERRALKATQKKINIPRISYDENKALLADPVVQKLLEYYENTVLDEINSLGASAGIKGKRNTRYYMQMRPLTEEGHREYLKSGKNAVVIGTGSKNVPMQYRKRSARAARMASGGAFAYGMDMRDLLENMHSDRWSATTRNNLVAYLRRYDLSRGGKNKSVPNKTTYAGKEVPVVALKIGDDKIQRFITKDKNGKPKIGSKLKESGTVMVPEPLRRLYNEVVNIRNEYKGGGAEFGNKAHSFLVGMQLATPAEAVWHANSLLSLLSTLPGINKNLLVRFGGDPTRFLGAMAEVYNLHGESAIKDYKELSRLGGIRGEGLPPEGALATLLHNIPISKQAREFVFDAPELEKKGIAGLESRSRLVLFRTLKNLGVSPTEAAFITNNKFGTYIQKLQPELARSFVRYFDPFVNFGIAKVKAGVNKMIGRGPQGFDKSSIGELLFNSWVMTPAVMAVVQRLSDPDGRWPWDIPGLPVGYIRVEKSDRGVVDIPFARVMANTWWRSLRHTGVAGAVEAYVNGQTDAAGLASGWLRSATNANLGRVGAIPRLGFTALTGRIPYLGNDFLPMQIVPQSGLTGFDQIKENAKWTATHFWSPLGEAGSVLGDGGRVPASDSQAQQAYRTVLAILGFLPRYGATEDQSRAGPARGKRGRVSTVSRDIVSRARRLFGPDDIDSAETWIEEQFKERLADLPEEDRDIEFLRALRDYMRYTPNTERYLDEIDMESGDEK